MINQTLETADRTAAVEKYEALQVLLNENTEAGKAFKTLVTDGYLREKAIETTSLLATNYAKQPGIRSSIFEELVAISAFEGYLSMVENLGAPVEDDELEG